MQDRYSSKLLRRSTGSVCRVDDITDASKRKGNSDISALPGPIENTEPYFLCTLYVTHYNFIF